MKKNAVWITLVILLLLLLLFAFCRPLPRVTETPSGREVPNSTLPLKEGYAATECPPTPAAIVAPVLEVPKPKPIKPKKRKLPKVPDKPQPLLVAAPPPRAAVTTAEEETPVPAPQVEPPEPTMVETPPLAPEPLPEPEPTPVLLPAEPERPKRTSYFPQLGVRVGGNMPGWGLFVDLNALPYTSFNTPLHSRFSLGVVQEGNAAVAVMHVDEIAILSRDTSTTLYAGLGLNVPLSSNSKLGYDLILGVEKPVKMFGLRNEAVYIETGITTFSGGAILDKTATMLSAGYKFSL